VFSIEKTKSKREFKRIKEKKRRKVLVLPAQIRSDGKDKFFSTQRHSLCQEQLF
jgi:hypothetical protein